MNHDPAPVNYYQFTPPADTSERAALVKSWLGERESVSLLIQTRSHDMDGPAFVGVELNAKSLDTVLRLMAFCKSEDIEATSSRFPHWWHENDADAVRYSNFKCDGGEFFFRGEPKYGEGYFESCAVPPLMIAEALQAPRPAEADPTDGLQWFGKYLVYAEDDPAEFIEQLRDLMPEAEPEHTAETMTERMGASQQPDAASLPRRRPTI